MTKTKSKTAGRSKPVSQTAAQTDDALRRRLPGGRLILSGDAAEMLTAVVTLERAIGLVEQGAQRAVMFPETVPVPDPDTLRECLERIETVRQRLRAQLKKEGSK